MQTPLADVLAAPAIVSLASLESLADSGNLSNITELGGILIVAIGLIALLAEFVDSSLGMGYGTMLTPLLLFMGFARAAVVPSILISELLTGLTAAACHHGVGNVNFLPAGRRIRFIRPLAMRHGWIRSIGFVFPRHLRVALLLGGCSVVGAVIAVRLSLKVPKMYMNLYIAVLLVSLGVFVLVTMNRTMRFSWSRTAGLGLLAAFNKGLSGGGYGPLVVGGQVLSGQSARSAVGIVSLSEAMACMAGISTLVLSGGSFDWPLTATLCCGAVLSAPLASLAVKKVPQRRLRRAIGLLTIALGLLTLKKVIG